MLKNFVNLVLNFFLSFFKFTREKLNLLRNYSSPNTPPLLPTFDLETGYSAQSQSIITADGQSSNRRSYYRPPTNVQWPSIGASVALVSITLQAFQTFELLNSSSFDWICMALVFSLTVALVSIHTAEDYERASLLAVHAGILIVFTVLVMAIVINNQLRFKVVSVAVYLFGILIIILAKLFKRKP